MLGKTNEPKGKVQAHLNKCKLEKLFNTHTERGCAGFQMRRHPSSHTRPIKKHQNYIVKNYITIKTIHYIYTS